ncbi:hypothetical protein CFI10_17055 [Marinobacterium iners]|uniref:inovirus Gp2 family protein n=1 Tax=Marinobacterium iners TaxID=48076 RepID=UPI001A900CEF|nr:inovirus Gp2 family protein [Marinobacterium iners]QSR36659.1 hypothetical protein CFI10_17055 [Marinobacterium iners]
MNPYNPDPYSTDHYPHHFADHTDPWAENPHNTTDRPKRVPGSPQLRLYYGSHYLGWSVSQQPHYGGLIEDYLDRTWGVIDSALSEYPRVYAVRVDLRYPQGYPAELSRDNQCMKRFFEYLQRELDRAGLKYPTRVHYVWAREQDRSPNPHYHLVLMFNQDAVHQIGTYTPCNQGGYHRQNLFHRIARAWAYALRLANDHGVEGLVHYAVGGQYDTERPYGCDDPYPSESVDHSAGQFQIRQGQRDYELARLYYRASYLCKTYSKRLGEGVHCFGSSRRRRR